LKSAATIPVGPLPTPKFVAVPKPPEPLLSSTETVCDPFAVAMSGCESLFKLPRARLTGPTPVGYETAGANTRMAAAAGNASTPAARQPAINGRAAERNKDFIVPPSDPITAVPRSGLPARASS
jgi:hypothetical protein